MTREPDSEHRSNGPEDAKVQVRMMTGCLMLSLILSIGGTILINVLIRLFN
ncbi:MAG: hypothetical protein JWL76_460 [Thermoleophilia bacterium]|nr:hypothetical protein [Thermoleophilia bacterium]